jgi:hypothetical protein
MLLTGHSRLLLGARATESSGFLRRTPQWWDSMKYIYNSFFLFMIMLSVIWFGAGPSASENAPSPTASAHHDANVERCSLSQSEADLSARLGTRDE